MINEQQLARTSCGDSFSPSIQIALYCIEWIAWTKRTELRRLLDTVASNESRWLLSTRVKDLMRQFFYQLLPSPPLDNIRVMVIVWRLRENIIRTVLCWIVWHNVHSQQHTYMRSSYRSNRLGLSHWDPYAVCRGGCLELSYCNIVEWFWWDLSLIFDDQLFSFSALTLLVWSSGL